MDGELQISFKPSREFRLQVQLTFFAVLLLNLCNPLEPNEKLLLPSILPSKYQGAPARPRVKGANTPWLVLLTVDKQAEQEILFISWEKVKTWEEKKNLVFSLSSRFFTQNYLNVWPNAALSNDELPILSSIFISVPNSRCRSGFRLHWVQSLRKNLFCMKTTHVLKNSRLRVAAPSLKGIRSKVWSWKNTSYRLQSIFEDLTGDHM